MGFITRFRGMLPLIHAALLGNSRKRLQEDALPMKNNC
jgi:hypothetical protein